MSHEINAVREQEVLTPIELTRFTTDNRLTPIKLTLLKVV